jgi:hypothetical protein
MSEVLFPDIFTKLEQVDTKPRSPVTQVWKQITPTIYQCKVTGRKLTRLQFLRFQDEVGAMNFIVEVFR